MQTCRGALQRGSIGPPAMAAELVFEVAPDALYKVQLWRIGRQPQWTHPVGSGREQAGDGNDGVPFGRQEQSVSAAADPGIGIGAGQLTQRFLLRTQVP